MALKTILSPNQTYLLQRLAQEPFVYANFYLAGGTALAEFYLHHRYSEDLDFFSEQEVDPQAIFVLLKKIKPGLGITKIEHEQSFNRNLFFVTFKKEIIKTEFTFFPFPSIERGLLYNETLRIDSLYDIAVNKIFTIYQRPRSRDFIDLFCIIKKNKWDIADLVKKAQIKFDWHVDPIQLGAQFLQAAILKDYPRMIKKLDPTAWQKVFLMEAEKFKKNIFG